MTRYLLLILLLLAGIASGSAQHKQGKNREQMFKEIQEFKIKYLAQEMELRDDQKQRFADLYNEMTERKMECMQNARRAERHLKKMENPTDADYQAATEVMEKARDEDAAIDKAYSEKFAQFLSSKQIFKMKQAEDKFRRKMEEMRRNGKKKDKK